MSEKQQATMTAAAAQFYLMRTGKSKLKWIYWITVIRTVSSFILFCTYLSKYLSGKRSMKSPTNLASRAPTKRTVVCFKAICSVALDGFCYLVQGV